MKYTPYIFAAIVAYIVVADGWVYPTQDGIAFGIGEFGYFQQY